MMKYRILISGFLLALSSFAVLAYVGIDENDNFSEQVKIALRDSGNRLLLSNDDSTSLILPIIELDKNNFELSFQNKLSILPDSLVTIIDHSLEASHLPNSYIVEVINLDSGEVSYSYEVKKNIEENIIPCIGRNLPKGSYKIKVLFTEQQSILISYKNPSLISLIGIGFLSFGLLYWKKGKMGYSEVGLSPFSKIGSYEFHKEQNKLIRGSSIIKLSVKECELISIFAEKPNQIIKRDFLIKAVWEDNGVFVGRSLDTFISKIRKKFEGDDSIHIITIHGVGYKLEIS